MATMATSFFDNYDPEEVIADSEEEEEENPRVRTLFPPAVYDTSVAESISVFESSARPPAEVVSSISSFTNANTSISSIDPFPTSVITTSTSTEQIDSSASAPARVHVIPQRAYKMPKPRQRKVGEPSSSSTDPTPKSSSAPRTSEPLTSSLLSLAKKVPPPEEVISLLSSDHDVPIPVKPMPPKKRKLSDRIVAEAGPSPPPHRPTPKPKAKPRRVDSDEDEGGDDPMILKPPPIAKKPSAVIQYDDERFSDFDPAEGSAQKRPKVKPPKKKKVKDVEGGGPVAEVNHPQPDKKPKSKKGESSAEGAFKSKEFIEDSDDDLAVSVPAAAPAPIPTPPIPRSGPSGLQVVVEMPAPKKKRKSKGADGDRPQKKLALVDEDDIPAPLPGSVAAFSQRNSVRVALAKSTEDNVAPNLIVIVAPDSPVEATIEPPAEKPKKKKKKDPKLKAKADQQEAPSPADVTPPAKEAVVVDARSESRQKLPAPEPEPEAAIEEETTAHHAQEVVSKPMESVKPTPKKPVPQKVIPSVSTPTTSASGTPSRGSIPYWRRPNKPLSDLLNQAKVSGSQPRPSGLHKSIRIAPLHLNRKPPPPPLPPMPSKQKKAAKNGGSDDEDDEDETPKARMKRLVAELESLEGMDSKKANDRRKEVNEEMARLLN